MARVEVERQGPWPPWPLEMYIGSPIWADVRIIPSLSSMPVTLQGAVSPEAFEVRPSKIIERISKERSLNWAPRTLCLDSLQEILDRKLSTGHKDGV